MAAPTGGGGSRWRRPDALEARPSSPPNVVLEEGIWAGSSRVPGVVSASRSSGAPALSVSWGVPAGRWARALAELSGLGRPRGWSSAANVALLGFPTSSSALKRGEKKQL